MSAAMQCSEFPSLADFVPGSIIMRGERWLKKGAHQYDVQAPIDRASPFATIQEAARRHGVRAEWKKDAGVMHLSGGPWKGFAVLRGAPDLALGEYLELIVEFPVDPAQAQREAAALAKKVDVLAPFADLAEEHGAAFEIASRMEYADAVFGYVELRKPGFGAFLSQHLDGWLAERGFRPERARETTLYRRGRAAPIAVKHTETSPDWLRVDVAGLTEFQTRPAAPPSGTVRVSGAPQPAHEVFARAMCIMAMFDRLAFEQAWKGSNPSERRQLEQLDEGLVQWLERERLPPALTPSERRLLLSPLGAWNPPTYVDVSWWMEAAGTLAWALGYFDALPSYDQQVQADAVSACFPSPAPIYERVSQARLRPIADVRQARDVAAMHEARAERGSAAWSIARERLRALDWICGVAPWD